ncbi:putative methyltransferase NSUN5, partial [Stegodyphus mimosarum]
MKTAHIAALMENKGQIFAYEKDNTRFEILKSTLIHGNIKICKTYCKDFRTVDPADDKNSNIDYILLDPTCSGSGMVSRLDAATDTENSKNEERLQKLAGFQIVLLKHALKFPNVKRVVYSTCSITEEENEYVVHEALNNFSDQFRLVNIMPDWSVRGSPKYEYGNLCLRSYPDKNLTNGFFVAMFERTELNNVSNSNTLIKMSKEKKNKRKRKIDSENDKDFLSSNSQKQFKNNNWCETNAGDVNSEQKEKVSQSETLVKKKLKKKHKIKTDILHQTSNNERKNFCEEDDFSLPVLQEELQRNNYIMNNSENLNLEKTEGTNQSECHMKKKHKKKNSFGKPADGEKNNFVKNENGDFHSCTSQKQYYRNANNIKNATLEQIEKTEVHQSEIHFKKKCKKKHKYNETGNSEEKSESIKHEDGNDFHSSISEKHNRNIYSTINVNLEEIENEKPYQSNTHAKKKCKKKHKYDDGDIQYKSSNGEEKSNCEESNDFFSQKHHEKNRFAGNGVENVDSEQKVERKETCTSETHVKKKCKKKHKSNKTDVPDSQKNYQKNNFEQIKLENSNSEQKEETGETYLEMCTKKKHKKKSVNCNKVETDCHPDFVIENVNTEIHVKS